jgi:hypothetical protein
MESFKRSLLGYRRSEVDGAITARDTVIHDIRLQLARREQQILEHEQEISTLSAMVIEREREIRILVARLEEANAVHDRSIASLDAVTARLEEIQAQARGQATRIRMKALREAVEVSRRVQALTEAHEMAEEPTAGTPGDGLYEGDVRLEIGPLGDFSQLVGFEDAVGRAGASAISIERFSEGRATLSMHLDQPVELLRELEGLSSLEFRVRHTAPDSLVLDVDEDQDPGRQAA